MESTQLMPNMPPSGSPAKVSRRPLARWAAGIAIVLLCGAHFAFLMAYFEPAISTPDANGYLGQATLIAQTGRSWFTLETPLQFVGMHWLKTPAPAGDDRGHRYYSRYPPGLSLIEAAALKMGGPRAALMVDPLLSSLTLLALFLLCRLWVGPGWGLLAAAAMAVNPAANAQALSHFAHTGAAFFFVWGLLFLAQWERTRAPRWAFAAGLALGIVPSIRYPEALLVAGCALFFLLNWRNDSPTRRSLLAAIAGLAFPLGALLARNQLAFGAFWKTGYALTNEQTGFGWNYLRGHFFSYIDGLQSGGAGPFFVLGVAGIAAMCARRDWRRRGVLLAALVVPSTLLYMAYYWGGMGGASTMSLRFLVPTLYVYVLAGVWLLKMAGETHPRTAVAAAGATLTLVVLWGVPPSILDLERLREGAAPLAKITEALERVAAPGSVVVSDQQILQHLHFIGRWRLVDKQALMNPAAGERRGGGPPGRGASSSGPSASRPSPQQAGKEEERVEAYMNLTGNELVDRMDDDIWAWAGTNGKVYWVGPQASIAQFARRLRPEERLTTIETIKLPKAPTREGDNEQRGGGGMGGGMPGPGGGMGGGMPGPGGGFGGPNGGGAMTGMPGGPGGFGGPSMSKAFQRPGPMGAPGFGGGPDGASGPSGMHPGPGGMGFSGGSEPIVIAEWTR